MKNTEAHIAIDRLQAITLTLALERLGKAQPLPNYDSPEETNLVNLSYRDGWFDCFEEIHLIAEQIKDEIEAKTNKGRISFDDFKTINKLFRGKQ
jgi:hypothetical protein